MKSIIKRYLVFVLGLYFLAAGVVLIVRSALGTTPISSIICNESEHTAHIGHLYVHHQHVAHRRSVLANTRTRKSARRYGNTAANTLLVHLLGFYRLQYGFGFRHTPGKLCCLHRLAADRMHYTVDRRGTRTETSCGNDERRSFREVCFFTL